MSRQIKTLLASCIAVAFLYATASPVCAKKAPALSAASEARANAASTGALRAGDTGDGVDKDTLSPSEKKIDSALLQLVEPGFMPPGASREQMILQLQSQRQLTRGLTKNMRCVLQAYVYIELSAGSNTGDIESEAVQIIDVDPNGNAVAARVELDMITELAARDCVKRIGIVTPPVFNSGSVTSQGDGTLKADVTRAVGGVDGAGVKIGVISDGVNHIASAIATGDIPGSAVVLSDRLRGDEGTAMLEVIHDLAPGARLYFHDSGDNIIQFRKAVNELVAAGCNVICDDVLWLNEPFFDAGGLSEYIDSLQDKNVVYVCSAGNFATRHYQGLYRGYGQSYHDFSGGKDAARKDLYATVKPGGSIQIVLQWDEPFGRAKSDYDLMVYDGAGDFVAYSANTQAGDGDPAEYAVYRNYTGSDVTLDIRVRTCANTPRTLELYLLPDSKASVWPDNLTGGDSIFGHAAARNVITCGAVSCAAPDNVEASSGQGPVTMLEGTRLKPDICGADGVSVTGAGGYGGTTRRFYGTSASAAHIAAIAALLRQKHPGLSASQVKQRLCGYARDLGPAGYDSVSGYGRADAYAAVMGDFEVTFVMNDGGAAFSRRAPAYGLLAEPATPVRAGFVFGGWCTDPGCKVLWNFPTGMVKSDMTLYARWIPETLPAPDALVKSGATYNSLSIRWQPVRYASGYEVWRANAADGEYCFAGFTRTSGFVDRGLATNKAYYYKVRAFMSVQSKKKNGFFTSVLSGVPLPSAPTVQVSAASYDSILLKWSPIAGATKYEVYRANTLTGKYQLVRSTERNECLNAGVRTGVPYYYKVRAYRLVAGRKACGEYSDVVSAKTGIGVPSGVLAARVSGGCALITWRTVAGAANFEIWRSTKSPVGPYTMIAVTGMAGYMDDALRAGETVWYKIRAYRFVGKQKVYGNFSGIVIANPRGYPILE